MLVGAPGPGQGHAGQRLVATEFRWQAQPDPYAPGLDL